MIVTNPPPGVPSGITYGCYVYRWAEVFQAGESLGLIGMRGAMDETPDWLISLIGSDGGIWEQTFELMPTFFPPEFYDPCD